jgi:uncharacterized protein
MNAEALLALQQIDSALDQNRHRRVRLAELAARETAAAVLRSAQSELASAAKRSAAAQAIIDTTEHATGEIGTKRTRLEAQLKTVIAPREAEALMHEIEVLGTRRDELDEQELEALGEQEVADGEAAQVRAALPAAEADLAEAQAALDAVIAELDAELSDLLSHRDAAAAKLTAGHLATYDRARKQFDGLAVARLDGTRCTGCHLDIARADLDKLRALAADQLGECPQCGRFLVR